VLIALGPSLATVGYSFTDASGLRGAPGELDRASTNYDEFLFQGLASRDNIDATLQHDPLLGASSRSSSSPWAWTPARAARQSEAEAAAPSTERCSSCR
jgi:hypothetical protein